MRKILNYVVFLLAMVALISSAASAVVVIPKNLKNMNENKNTINWISSGRDDFPEVVFDIQSNPVPLPPSVWLHFDNGVNDNALGLTEGGTFEYGIKLTPAELSGYHDYLLTTIRHHHGWEGNPSDPSVFGFIKIYDEGTPSSPGTLLHKQNYTTLSTPGWEDYTLTSTITINATKDLWICLEVTHNQGEFPAGIDPDPAVAGKGDWIYHDSTWKEIKDLGVDNNWNLWAGVDCNCGASIDVEKQVWDPKTGRYIDADTPDEALDLPFCTSDSHFKITMTNAGECVLKNLTVTDIMSDSLEYLGASPNPDLFDYTPPEYKMEWYKQELDQTQVIEIIIEFHVSGNPCDVNSNYVKVDGTCIPHETYVEDEDLCYIHVTKDSREFNRPILNFLHRHPNLFPLLQKLIQRIGLY